MEEFKIRCSGIHEIMGAFPNEITAIQLAKTEELQAKEKRTKKQSEELSRLIEKRDAKPELPKGAKTYCEQWLKEQIYGRRYQFNAKYTEKGNIVEDDSIQFISSYFGVPMVKNEKHFSDDEIEGTPDLLPEPHMRDIVLDAKNSWDCFTFPLFFNGLPNKDYWWQMQGYMALTGRTKAKVVYTLMNTPESLVRDDMVEYYNYDNVDDKFKIKVFDVYRDEDAIQQIRERVRMCRQYIDELYLNF